MEKLTETMQDMKLISLISRKVTATGRIRSSRGFLFSVSGFSIPGRTAPCLTLAYPNGRMTPLNAASPGFPPYVTRSRAATSPPTLLQPLARVNLRCHSILGAGGGAAALTP